MIEDNLRAYLLAQPDIFAKVATRIFPVRRPQGAQLPAITYQRISGLAVAAHSGRIGIARAVIQIDCWGADANDGFEQSINLAAAVRTALSGYRGPMGDDPRVVVFAVNDTDLSEPETKVWRRMVQASLGFTEVAA